MAIIHLGVGVIPTPPGDISGSTEQIIYRLTRELSVENTDVHVIDIKGGSQQDTMRRDSGAQYHTVPHIPLPHTYQGPFQRALYFSIILIQLLSFAALAIFPLIQLIRKNDAVIIHSHNAITALMSILVKKISRKNVKTVYTLHSAYGMGRFSLFNRIVYFAEPPTLKWIDHIIVLNPSIGTWVHEQFGRDPTTYTGIPNAIDLTEIKSFLARSPDIQPTASLIICVGVIAKRKNQKTAIEVFANISKDNPDCRLVLAGRIAEQEYYRSLQALVQNYQMNNQIEFKGEMPPNELYKLLSIPESVFLFPTTAEMDPIALKEAMGFGLPVVASRIQPIVDVLGPDQINETLFESNDVSGMSKALNRILNDPNLRTELGQRSTRLIQEMSYGNIAGRTQQLYNELMK
ncbi:MAG: glycosyltransferase family 4 protein [SAR202 cluster bacterium]|nr:glycosyltransferase family 4 protein [SAR202 cluster bacterium]|tara:strand:+ start:72 stop:1283 length:1212 start_codon:yes stop_codon:yes gene_type:complete